MIYMYIQQSSLNEVKLHSDTEVLDNKLSKSADDMLNSAVIILKFLIYIYQMKPEIRLIYLNSNFITGLIGLLVPTQCNYEVNEIYSNLIFNF